MSDLFATATEPSPVQPTTPPTIVTLPARPAGALSYQAERTLYETDRAGWIAYVAPKLAAAGVEAVAEAWPFMREDYRAAVWKLFDPPTRRAAYAAIVAARERPPAPDPEAEPEEAAA